jgi:glucan phosphoethanolaminetransferase (alkaline phosphatase superfamily)
MESAIEKLEAPLVCTGQRVGVRRRHRITALLLLLAPALISVGLDFAHRGRRIVAFDGYHRLTYLGSVLESAVLGGLLLAAAARRCSHYASGICVLFVLALTAAIGGQHYFFQQYNAYLNTDVSEFASNFKDSIVNQLLADLGNYMKVLLPILTASIGLIVAARRWVRLKRRQAQWVAILAPLLLVSSMFAPTQHRQFQACTPDILYFNAVGGVLRTTFGFTEQSGQLRPMARHSLPVPPLVAQPARPRNVLLVLLESVRADATCIDYDPNCRRTEATNRLFPNRIGLHQLRALDSSTAITLAVLWSGLQPTESRERLHTQPLVFDYAKAAGYHTAYLTSQNLLFGNTRLWVKNLGVDRFCSATELDPESDLDMGAPETVLAERVKRELETLPEPFLAVVQLSNVHYPYLVDNSAPQPFQPASRSKAPEDNYKFFNQYQNAVYQQDRHVYDFLNHMQHLPAAARTVTLYTSDHGEAFREHGNMGHTFSVLDEEIHVPGWIDAPPGTLTDEERANLASKRNQPLTHVDLTQTIIDLLGVHDAPEIQAHRAHTFGNSLLRPEVNEEIMALSNCAGVWSCAFENWGALKGWRKVEAREWDTRWRCFDLRSDPKEQHDLGEAACADLVSFAKSKFTRLPGRIKDRERHLKAAIAKK